MYGKKLKEIRKHLSQTQEGMAELLKISARTYSSYERDENNPSYSMLVTLCQEFNVNLNWLIADYGKMFITRPFKDIDEDVLEIVKNIVSNELDRRGIKK